MKTFLKLFPFLVTTVALTACATNPLLTPQTTSTPVVSQVTETNYQTVTTEVFQTNNVGVTTTNFVTVTNPVVQTVLQTNIVTITNGYTVSSGASNVLGTLTAANTLTGAFDPFSGTVAAVLGLLSGGLAFYAKSKTTALQTHATAAQTIVTAVENLEPATAAAVKTAISNQGAKMGTSAEVNSVVNSITANL